MPEIDPLIGHGSTADLVVDGHVLRAQRIDGGRDDRQTWHAEARRNELPGREHHRVVLLDEWLQEPPDLRVRARGVDVRAPDPTLAGAAPEVAERRRLRVVDDVDVVVVAEDVGRLLVLSEVELLDRRREVEWASLQRVVEALGDAEEFLLAANDPPVHMQAEVLEQRHLAPEKLGDATAGGRGVDVADADPTERAR